ncbi:hypothetical protein SAMN04515647_1918 [Cohaesibacter sp. ES.047]|uniref:hypothetical protein n=1 Tax=Cohaesibacter sp. ES.047 TaxID=1798205 RepID=UPI000BB8C9F0|nr:hypothetical protein [Cohaesibacter sp. ES.047]SNY91690.1 hypothetical protein SAMN04515647_1918 [Cohaesibacter sp. ES.047]
MTFGGTVDLNWHHKEVVVLDLRWVKKTMVLHVEMKQFEENKHQGIDPSIILTRRSPSKKEDILIVSGRATAHILVSLDHEEQLVGRIDTSNPNAAGSVKWEIVA